MSAPQWKPGDVAMICWKSFTEARGFYIDGRWMDVDSATFNGDEDDLTIRPLVVIDPEDREQVGRLARVTHIAYTGDVPEWPSLSERGRSARIDALTMALHAEVVNKPDEPQGLGAVVEDAEGQLWFRMTTENQTFPGEVWQERYGEADRWSKWEHISIVRVLSAGWSE